MKETTVTQMVLIEEKCVFNKQIRRAMKDGVVYYSIVDVISTLTDSDNPGSYWRKLKQRLLKEKSEVVTNCHGLKLTATDGKKYLTDVTTEEGVYRLIQSIPSPKVEPFKRWFAQLAKERIEEMRDPELAIRRGKRRAAEHFIRLGMTESQAQKRVKAIDERIQLTDRLKSLGFMPKDYMNVSKETHRGAFGITPASHKDLKELKKSEELRNHFTKIEQSFSELSEINLRKMIDKKKPKSKEEIDAIVSENKKLMAALRAVQEAATGEKIASADSLYSINQITLQ